MTDRHFAGGLDVHRSEDFNFHLHCGAISSHSRLPHARNTGTAPWNKFVFPVKNICYFQLFMIDNCADDWRIAMTWQRMMQIGERESHYTKTDPLEVRD